MRHITIVAIVLASSLASVGCVSGRYVQYDGDRSTGEDTLAVMTKEDVIALSQAKVSDDVIISQIRASESHFQLTTQDIIDLTNAGVSDKVVQAMIKAGDPSRYPRKRWGYYYYPPRYWYAGYPYWYSWYPSFYLGYSYRYYRPFYRPFYVYRGFYGGRGFGGRR